MNYKRRDFKESDFIRIRDFLKKSCQVMPPQYNWLIDRWNWCRYFEQIVYDSFDAWPESVGVWVDENDTIVFIVNSEGEGRGEAFFQFGINDYPDHIIDEMLDFAERKLFIASGMEKCIYLRVNPDSQGIKNKLADREYTIENWKETTCSIELSGNFATDLSSAFSIVNANEISLDKRILAHILVFNSDDPGNAGWAIKRQNAYKSLISAPDYKPELDFSVIDEKGEVVSFSTVWYDDENKYGVLEPVGTIPTHRLQGLGKAAIYAGMNKVKELGAKKVYVGSDQQFYHSIGFSIAFEKEVWQKRWT